MPSNMKMPIIKVTPSSPSPDPNHPDYPEFFEDKLYLDHVSKKTTDKESDTKQNEIKKEVSFDSFTLVLDPDESDDEDILMSETVKLAPEKSSLKMRRQNSLYKSSLELENESEPVPNLSKDTNHNISIEMMDSTINISNSKDD